MTQAPSAAGEAAQLRGEARRRLYWNGAVGLAAAGAALAIALWPPFQMAEARVFDLFSTLDPPALADVTGEAPVVIVAIDEPSLAEAGSRWPWPRSRHAELIEVLRAAGARAIGLDLVFAEPSDPVEDAALAQAMGPDVVLAADESVIETTQGRQILRAEPLPELTAPARARSGLASVALDRDGVLRRLPPWPGGFAARLLEAAGESSGALRDAAGTEPGPEEPGPEVRGPEPQGGTPATRTTTEPRAGQGAEALPPRGYLQVFGPARTYPTVSYYQALDPLAFLPEGVFRDRIVLVGLSLQTAVEAGAGSADAFATPQTARTGQLTPGVEIQATILDNLRHGLVIRPAPPWAGAAAVALAVLAALAIVRRPVDHRAYLAGAALLAVLALASWGLLLWGRVFLPPLAPGLAALGTLVAVAARDQTAERRLRRRISRAFSRYLAPEMVRRLARDPASLRLGGERRVLSILFCDVRNFTPLAERLKDEPERLTHLVNRLLTPLSEAVLDQGGTIDKYIGDCVMAFWNAPLDDPDHAPHAVAAGLAMLAAIDRLNAEFAAEGAQERLAVGVGINTGVCVVGNMGSDRRFDYSALGDAVNYASRLEGASKECGVPLLLGAATAAALAGRFEPVLAGLIAVKGRGAPQPVFTVLPDPPLPAGGRRRHEALMQDLIAGRRGPDDPEIATLSRDAPALAPILARTTERGPVSRQG